MSHQAKVGEIKEQGIEEIFHFRAVRIRCQIYVGTIVELILFVQ